MRMSRKLTALLTALAMLTLGGCVSIGGPAQFTYVSLPPVPPAAADNDTPRVMTGPFELPAYLDRMQRVIRGDDGRVTIRENERWAEPLDGAVIVAVNDRLRRQLGSRAVVPFPSSAYDDYSYRVTGKFARFEATDKGAAVLETVWALLDNRGETRAGPFYSTYTTDLYATDSAAIAGELGGLLDAFSADVAALITALEAGD